MVSGKTARARSAADRNLGEGDDVEALTNAAMSVLVCGVMVSGDSAAINPSVSTT